MATFTHHLPLVGDEENEEVPLIKPIGSDFKTITIRWKSSANVPTIRGKWKRLSDGRIEAMYTQDELKKCIELSDLIV